MLGTGFFGFCCGTGFLIRGILANFLVQATISSSIVLSRSVVDVLRIVLV